MTKEFACMLDLFACGAKGIKPEINGDIDLDTMLKLARKQSVYSVVAYALTLTDGAGLPAGRLRGLRDEMLLSASRYYARLHAFSRLAKKWEEEGIAYAVLKGFTMSRLYAEPSVRLSSDIDVYVGHEQESGARKVLLQNGFALGRDREGYSHHSVLSHPVMGQLELHAYFYGERSNTLFFKSKENPDDVFGNQPTEPFERITDGEYSCFTLGRADNLLYLFLHIVKHFIHGGLSLRAVMDFMFVYTAQIDQEILFRFWHRLRELRYDYFCKTVLAFGVRYFRFAKETVACYEPVDQALIEELADHTEQGGWLGLDSASPTQAVEAYAAQKAAELGTQADQFEKRREKRKRRWKFKHPFAALLPQYSVMAEKYSYLKKRPFLLPVAWVQRGIDKIRGKKRADSDQSEQTAVVSQTQMALYKKLKMMD